MPPPKFDPDAETWQDVCPWCASYETFQIGTETHTKIVVWCRSCSGSSWLYRGQDRLQARTPPKWLHDKRRPRVKQREPLLPSEARNEARRLR